MNQFWQRLGPIAPGGTILGMAGDGAGRLWLASGAGIFRPAGNSWSALDNGQPISQINALAWAGDKLLAGGGLGQIVYSTDEGENWYLGRVSQTEAAITCLAVSPNLARDGVILAGTSSDGILRSSDDGRSWRLANAGLQDFSILALAAAPKWDRREVVFAGTTRGLYRSPNGGRAWKLADAALEEAVVLALAVSPDFAGDGVVLAGSEGQGVFRSGDGGRTWQPANRGLEVDGDLPAINALWLHPNFAEEPVALAGMADGRIFRSEDSGASWGCAVSGDDAVMCLASAAGQTCAGLNDAGLLASADGGRTWAAVDGLAARSITRLVSGQARRLYAFGPAEGVWHSADGGQNWRRLAEIEPVDAMLLALATSPEPAAQTLLASSTAGLGLSTDGGQTWQTHLAGHQVSALALSPDFAEDRTAWAGTAMGILWQSSDGGSRWSVLDFPGGNAPIVALAASANPAGGMVLAAGTVDPVQQRATLWYSDNAGQTWRPWLQAEADPPALHLNLTGKHPLAGFGRTCWRLLNGQWQRVLETLKPLVSLAPIPGLTETFIATADEVLRSGDGQEWSNMGCPALDGRLMDLVVIPDAASRHTLLALALGGTLWQCHPLVVSL